MLASLDCNAELAGAVLAASASERVAICWGRAEGCSTARCLSCSGTREARSASGWAAKSSERAVGARERAREAQPAASNRVLSGHGMACRFRAASFDVLVKGYSNRLFNDDLQGGKPVR